MTSPIDAMNNYSSDLAMRDKLLAYLYQLDMGARESLELALSAMEKAASEAAPHRAFEILLSLLNERGDMGPARPPDKMTPPMRRQPMVSEGLNISIRDSLARMIAGNFRAAPNKESGEKGDRP
jgi:hypothetical protein